MSTKIHPKNVHEMSPKKCPRKVTQKEDFSWTLLSTRCHQKCPREVTPFVHEKSPIMSTRCLPPMPCWNIVSTTNILAVQCFDIHTQPVNCKFVFAVYWHGPVGVYGAEFPRHLGAKPQIYCYETLDLINLARYLLQ